MQKQLTDSERRPSHDEIAKRAYAIFEQTGRIPGRDMENWLEAENQLLAVARKPSAATRAPNGAAKTAGRMVMSQRA